MPASCHNHQIPVVGVSPSVALKNLGLSASASPSGVYEIGYGITGTSINGSRASSLVTKILFGLMPEQVPF